MAQIEPIVFRTLATGYHNSSQPVVLCHSKRTLQRIGPGSAVVMPHSPQPLARSDTLAITQAILHWGRYFCASAVAAQGQKPAVHAPHRHLPPNNQAIVNNFDPMFAGDMTHRASLLSSHGGSNQLGANGPPPNIHFHAPNRAEDL